MNTTSWFHILNIENDNDNDNGNGFLFYHYLQCTHFLSFRPSRFGFRALTIV